MPRVVLALTTRKAEHAVLVEQVGDTPAGAKRQCTRDSTTKMNLGMTS